MATAEDVFRIIGVSFCVVWVRFDASAFAWRVDLRSWFGVTSPCIDGGDPLNPVDYEPFPNGGIVDMGVYGGATEASLSH